MEFTSPAPISPNEERGELSLQQKAID